MLEENWENIAKVLLYLWLLTFFIIGLVGMLWTQWKLFCYLRERMKNPGAKAPDHFDSAWWKEEFPEESGSLRIMKKLKKSLIIVWCLGLSVVVFSILLASLYNE